LRQRRPRLDDLTLDGSAARHTSGLPIGRPGVLQLGCILSATTGKRVRGLKAARVAGLRTAAARAQFRPGGCDMRAYVLINVRPGKVREIVSAVSQMEGVRHADACWGLPDVFVYVETPSEKRLNELVIDKIQKLEGVERTETHIAVE